MGWPFFNLFGKGDAVYYLYAHVHACSLSYPDEELKTLQSIPKQCVLWLVDHSFDRAIKTLWCL